MFYDTSPVRLSNDGFQYSCLVTDNMIPAARAQSAVVTLHVGDGSGGRSGTRSLPPTGDGQTPMLWLGLCALCGAGLAALAPRKKRGA